MPIRSQPKHRFPGGHNSPVGSRKSAEKVPRKALTRYPSTYVPSSFACSNPRRSVPDRNRSPLPAIPSFPRVSIDRQNCGLLMITDDQWFTELAALVIGVRVLPRQAKATGMESPLPACIRHGSPAFLLYIYWRNLHCFDQELLILLYM